MGSAGRGAEQAATNTGTTAGNYKVHEATVCLSKILAGPRCFKGGLKHLLESSKQPQVLENSG